MGLSFWDIATAGSGADIVLVLVQEASDLSPQHTRLQDVTHRPCGIEEFALQLCGNRIPLHDDSCAEAAKNMLFNRCGSPALAAFPSNSAQLAVLRTNDLVEIVRQPFFILR